MRRVCSQLGLGLLDVNVVEQVERQRLHVFQVVVPAAQIQEILLPAVEDGRNSPPDVDFPLNLQILERLPPKTLLAERAAAAGYGARGWSLAEDPVDAGFTHLVVTGGIDEESHVGVQIASRLTNRADFLYGATVSRWLSGGMKQEIASPSSCPGVDVSFDLPRDMVTARRGNEERRIVNVQEMVDVGFHKLI